MANKTFPTPDEVRTKSKVSTEKGVDKFINSIANKLDDALGHGGLVCYPAPRIMDAVAERIRTSGWLVDEEADHRNGDRWLRISDPKNRKEP